MIDQPYQKAAQEVIEFLLSKGYTFDADDLSYIRQELGCDLWESRIQPPTKKESK
jgi:hypothetical protein